VTDPNTLDPVVTTHPGGATTATRVTPIRDMNAASSAGLTVTVEGISYTFLAIIVALMFTLRLGIVPLTADEIPRALAGWQAVNDSISQTALADSALLQLGHMFVISAFGSDEAAVRLPTALAGILLVFSPLLFRSRLGAPRTFVMCLLLATSPIVLAASRLDSPVIWEMGFGVLSLWALQRFLASGHTTHAVTATVLFATTALLTGPTGHVLLLTLLLAFVLLERLLPDDTESQHPTVWETFRIWPWRLGLLMSALMVVVVSTLFMIYPQGFNAVGQSIGNGLRGWIFQVDDAPLLFAAFASLIYEPILWIFGIAAVVTVTRQDRQAPIDLFFAAWLIVGGLASVAYAGSTAANALWLTFPLVGLASGLVVRLFQAGDGTVWFNENDRMNSLFGVAVPDWVRWAVAATTALLFCLVLMHVGEFGRTLLVTNLVGNWGPALNQLAPSLLILIVLILLLVFVGFTAASLWGGSATLRGGAIGLLFVGMFASLGAGWQIAYNRADDPTELWHTRAYGEDIFVLRETLIDLTRRETGGFQELDVVVITDGFSVTDDGMIAWVLRDFENATFVQHTADARAQAVVLSAITAEPPELGGNYFGQSFTLSRDWDVNNLSAREIPVWWFQRNTRVPGEATRSVVLWLREDVYEGVDIPGLQ
jgi:hypothetical protein